jgi:hypothetical protein
MVRALAPKSEVVPGGSPPPRRRRHRVNVRQTHLLEQMPAAFEVFASVTLGKLVVGCERLDSSLEQAPAGRRRHAPTRGDGAVIPHRLTDDPHPRRPMADPRRSRVLSTAMRAVLARTATPSRSELD